MATPTPSIPSTQVPAAGQIEGSPQDLGPKQGASKFDQVLARSTQEAGGTGRVGDAHAPRAAHHVEAAHGVERISPADHAKLNRTSIHAVSYRGPEPVTAKESASKPGALIGQLLSNIENGQHAMDKLLKVGMSGKDLSNQDLIRLQAGMYQYTQELDLTGKVVEKATSGLRDTLRTQV